MTYEMRMKDLRDEAHAEGKAEGLAEGLAEGKAKGLAEGKAEEKAATAKRLLSMGLFVEDIAKATSLSVEQVEAIKAE
jgi:predicted transposase/invertase (TIGR01784 family)